MKGIIRIASLEFRGLTYIYWNLFVVQEIQRRVKKEIGSSAIKNFRIFFMTDRGRYRVDYLIISCPPLIWNRLKKELEWRYVCVDPFFKFNKKKQSWVRTEVDFYKETELKDELSDFPAIIDSYQANQNGTAGFEIRLNYSGFNREEEKIEYLFYKPYENFKVDVCWDYRKNRWAGTLVLQAERKWKRNGGEKVWRKRKAWKLMNGNFKEVK